MSRAACTALSRWNGWLLTCRLHLGGQFPIERIKNASAARVLLSFNPDFPVTLGINNCGESLCSLLKPHPTPTPRDPNHRISQDCLKKEKKIAWGAKSLRSGQVRSLWEQELRGGLFAPCATELALSLWVCSACKAQQHRGREIQESATKTMPAWKSPRCQPPDSHLSLQPLPGWRGSRISTPINLNVLLGKEVKLRRKRVERVPLGRLSDFYFLLCAEGIQHLLRALKALDPASSPQVNVNEFPTLADCVC